MPLAVLVGLAVGGVAIGLLVNAARDGNGEAADPVAAEPTPMVEEPAESLRIVFPEGFTWREMAVRVDDVKQIAINERDVTPALAEDEFRELSKNEALIPLGFLKPREQPKHVEGFLFPATYDFTESTTTADLVKMQIEQFELTWAELDLSFPEERGVSAYDVLKIASMVEEEVKEPSERRIVARVIYNRLARDMPLGIDSTLRYGLRIPADEAILQSQLQSDNPYNTRNTTGLPPTPISNPGRASMLAAAKPANNQFLFYARTTDCRTHFFAKTQAEFNDFLDGPNSFLRGPDRCN